MSDTREPDFETAEVPAESTRPRARLLPMWILIAAVVIVGVAWAMSERYFAEAEGEKSVPLVTAEDTPVKVRPEEPGGVDVPDRDKYVYKSLTEDEPEAEQLLPPPEEPMERPPVEVVEVAAPEAEAADAPEPPPPSELAVADVDTPAEGAPEAVMEETQAVDMVAAAEVPKATFEETEIQQTMKVTPAPEAEAQVEPEPEPPAAALQSAALSADTPGFLVQIGATQNEASANGEIVRLTKKHPDILAGLGSIVIRADLGAKGIWYRMRVGPFMTRAAADGACGRLKAVDIGCFVVAN